MDKMKTISSGIRLLAKGVGERLKRHRLAKGWTQEELAEKSGVALSTLKLFEAKGGVAHSNALC